MKGGKYTKTLAKTWVEGIIRTRDIRGNVLHKFIELCMETPCWSSSSLRKHAFLLALRRWGRFARRNVCDSATEIP